jgi:hypothetical protein
VFYFTEGFLRGTRQRALCRVPEIKHSAKNMTLGKELNSGNDQFRVMADVEAGKFKCECKQWEHTGMAVL